MPSVFTRYQKFVVAVLAFLQFTIILDFMIIGPLGALLLRDLHITTGQFGLAVSAYAFSAGASGLLAAGFADKFDRKRLAVLLCGVPARDVPLRRGEQLSLPAGRAHRHRRFRRRHRLDRHGPARGPGGPRSRGQARLTEGSLSASVIRIVPTTKL